MAITGHRTLKEVDRYTRGARQGGARGQRNEEVRGGPFGERN
jgi:hypothetical protein